MKKILVTILALIIFTSTAFAGDPIPNNVDFGSYMKYVQKQIKKAWNPPKKDESVRVVTIFTLNKKGEITNIKIPQSSKDAEIDKAAIAAIETLKPKPLPKTFKGDSIDVHFTFDYNVFGLNQNKILVKDDKNKFKPYDPNVANKTLAKTYDKYVRYVANKSKKNWYPINLDDKYQVSFNITLANTGKIKNLEITESSGVKVADQRVLKNIQDIKFKKFPKKITHKELTFNINLFYDPSKARAYPIPIFIPLLL